MMCVIDKHTSLTWFWRCPHDDFHTRERRVVLPTALFAVHVTKRIRILLLKLVVIHHFGEMVFPEYLGVFCPQSSTLHHRYHRRFVVVSIMSTGQSMGMGDRRGDN